MDVNERTGETKVSPVFLHIREKGRGHMTYQEVLERAREVMAPKCTVCKVCDGKACAGRQHG